MNTTLETRACASAAATTQIDDRFNVYTAIHKALRSAMADMLVRIGRLDVDDAAEFGATLAQLDALLRWCRDHIRHENDFVHTAIDARLPAGAARTAADHVDHVQAIAELGAEAGVLAAAPKAQRPILALRLYRHLALFIADNFQHMHVEETANASALWAHYTDAELHRIHDELLATLPPEEHLMIARWMVPASTPAERAAMLGGMKTQTPPEAFLGVLMHLRPHLDASGWAKLARAVGVAEAGPGVRP